MKDFARINHYGVLMEKIVEFRTDDRYCDVDIIVKERTFKCHRLILGAVSTYFDRMFSGEFKESSQKEVTLYRVEADLFENILQFVYEGDFEVINSSNVYRLICAAQFYELSMLKELCVMFVRENLNEIANDVLKMFLFAHYSAIENLVELLSRHINENFHYFSKLPEFHEFTGDQVDKVLDAIDRNGQQPVLQDVFYDGISEWVRHQVDRGSEEGSASFDRFRKINLCHLSVECWLRSSRQVDHGQPTSENVANDGASTSGTGGEKLPECLYAYVSRRSQGRPPTNTRIFALRSTLNICMESPYLSWISSGELKRAYDFLRTIVIDDRLYSLGYWKKYRDPEQIFMTGTSIPMYPYVPLKSPPLILDEFDMCGTGDYIYVYSKKSFTSDTIRTCGDSTFSEDQLSYGMYMYKRDADKWFPLPYPTIRFNDACMTCDEKLVYLIGGENSGGYVQAYDVRTRGWSALPSTASTYDRAACCVAGDKVYVAGGQRNPTRVEMYDPVSGRWQRIKRLPEVRYDKHQLVYWNSISPDIQHRGIVNFSNRVSPRSSIIFDDFLNHDGVSGYEWLAIPHVLDFVKYKNRTLTDRINILDMVNF